MKYVFIALALGLSSTAFAQGEGEQVRDDVWLYDIPSAPKSLPTCKIVGKTTMACDGQLNFDPPPVIPKTRNCGFTRKGVWWCG